MLPLWGLPEKEGAWALNSASEKNKKAPRKALVVNGRISCPYCEHYLGRAMYGAKAGGVDVFCIRCKKHTRIEL